MVCYARPASILAVMVMVGWLVFARPISDFLETAALMVAVAAATGVAAVAAALVFAAFTSTRRRRAAAGGCVGCQFRCQHAMTEPQGRLWLVTTTDRRKPGPDRREPGPVFLPMPPVGSAGVATPAVAGGTNGPRWPDRPAYRARDRAGSAA
jgi:hypothetical protein